MSGKVAVTTLAASNARWFAMISRRLFLASVDDSESWKDTGMGEATAAVILLEGLEGDGRSDPIYPFKEQEKKDCVDRSVDGVHGRAGFLCVRRREDMPLTHARGFHVLRRLST